MTSRFAADINRTIGQRIATLRKAKRLSQTKLGEHLGVTFQQVQKYENGTNRISSGRLQQIAQLFEVPLSVLFGEDEPTDQNDAFGFLALTGAVEILRAYAVIEDSDLRRDVLQLVRTASRIGIKPDEGKS